VAVPVRRDHGRTASLATALHNQQHKLPSHVPQGSPYDVRADVTRLTLLATLAALCHDETSATGTMMRRCMSSRWHLVLGRYEGQENELDGSCERDFSIFQGRLKILTSPAMAENETGYRQDSYCHLCGQQNTGQLQLLSLGY
jgi:hypothetical protein